MHSSKHKENLCRKVLKMQLAMGICREIKEICSAVDLKEVTKKYLSREEVKEYIEYIDMK